MAIFSFRSATPFFGSAKVQIGRHVVAFTSPEKLKTSPSTNTFAIPSVRPTSLVSRKGPLIIRLDLSFTGPAPFAAFYRLRLHGDVCRQSVAQGLFLRVVEGGLEHDPTFTLQIRQDFVRCHFLDQQE